MERLLADQIISRQRELRLLRERLVRTSPFAQINNAKQQVDELLFRVKSAAKHMLSLRVAAIEGLNQTLQVIGPLAILERGFALVHRPEDGSLIRSVDQITSGDKLSVRISDGKFTAEVTDEPDKDQL
jgi:exodeoxyribonuclease VII large subunit